MQLTAGPFLRSSSIYSLDLLRLNGSTCMVPIRVAQFCCLIGRNHLKERQKQVKCILVLLCKMA